MCAMPTRTATFRADLSVRGGVGSLVTVIHRALVLTALAGLVLAAPASAATVSIVDGTMTYTGTDAVTDVTFTRPASNTVTVRRNLPDDVDPVTGTSHDVVRGLEIVRLGQGVDRTGRLDPGALDRTFTALASYAATIDRLGAERIRMVATSATRDAASSSAGTSATVRLSRAGTALLTAPRTVMSASTARHSGDRASDGRSRHWSETARECIRPA